MKQIFTGFVIALFNSGIKTSQAWYNKLGGTVWSNKLQYLIIIFMIYNYITKNMLFTNYLIKYTIKIYIN